MPRYTFIHRWKPENTPAVFERFAKQLKGDFPEIIEANKKLNTIAWEFGSVFGQTISIWIVEGEPREISTVLRFWMDLHEIEALPCVGFNIIKQFYPEKHPYYQELSL